MKQRANPATGRPPTRSKTQVDYRKLGPVLEFMRVLWALDHGLQSGSKRMEAQIGVTGPQRLVVRLLGRFPGISAGTLSSLLHIHPSTLTGILKRLVERGLVIRRSDPHDARRALFDLTPRGREIDGNRQGTVEAIVRRALSRLDEAKVQTASDVLRAIADELDSF